MPVQLLPECGDFLKLHAAFPERYPYLLESLARGAPTSRYDILFALPGRRIGLFPGGPAFLPRLDAAWREDARPVPPDAAHLPFRGGWFVYLGYELAGEIEPVLRLPRAAGGLPAAFAARVPAALIRDHQAAQTWLVAEETQQAARILADLETAPPLPALADTPCLAELHEEADAVFLSGVERVRRYIRDGDVFQVNLSRRWHGTLAAPADAPALYRRLRRANPGPFAGLCRLGEHAILSSSPERLVRVTPPRIETRPIAGTYPRGATAAADAALAEALLAHPKERAEHIMLLDLLRNDLGRVCRPGSVRVDELMILETYAHVHHIVSNVRGELAGAVTPGEVIRAIFPGGTITGCPKVRCMQIIAELEGAARQAYTGAMGYLDHDGSLDLNILIRTLHLAGDRVGFRTGAGLVADSDPLRELAETRAKARGLLLALGAAA